MLEIWLNTFFILFIVGSITALANLAEQHHRLRPLLQTVILGTNMLILLFVPLAAFNPDVELGWGDLVGAFLVATLGGALAAALLLRRMRAWCARFFPRHLPPPAHFSMPIPVIQDGVLSSTPHPAPSNHTPTEGGFNPDSMTHMWALILVVQFLTFQFASFFLVGGLEGIAEDIGVNYGTLLANFLPTVLIPIIGVGLFIRRNPGAALRRLGIKPMGLKDLAISIGVSGVATVVLLMLVGIVVGIWSQLVSPETFEAQNIASNALAESVNTLGLAFLLALTAGIGEEIAFRGALQPIFGFWFTAFVFVLAHLQYTLTPAALLILIVALAFGLIRKYLDTTTAILTHFLYNFIPLALTVLLT